MIENNNIDSSINGIINSKNSNSFKEVSVIQSKEKDIILKKTSTEKYFIIYSSVLILIYISFFINYLITNNWYEENRHYINLKPIYICSNYIEKLEQCLKEKQKSKADIKRVGDIYMYDTKSICEEDNKNLQNCFDKVHSFSQVCQIYLNDLYLCKNNSGNGLSKCLNNNLLNCWRAYNIINISKVFDDI